MPKSKKAAQKTEPAEDTQKLYARAYAAHLAKQVSEESSPRPATTRKKSTAKAHPSFAESLRGLIIQNGWG